LLLILANRKRFIGPLQRAGRWLVSLRNYISGHRKAIAAQFRSPMALVVLLGCLALTWLISPVASLPIWLLLWISVASQLLEYWRNRVARKNAVSSAIKEQNA